MTKRPRLAVALLQISAQRTIVFAHRIASFPIDKVERRLARSLIHLSERLGTPAEDGPVQIMPFSHQMLSRHVGSSREIVSHCMNRFREQGYLRYSPQEIVLYRNAMAAWISGTVRSTAVSA